MQIIFDEHICNTTEIMGNLIERQDIADLTKIGNIKFPALAGFLMNILSIGKVNTFYNKNEHLDAISFIDNLFEEVGVKFEFNQEELKNLPKEGPFVTVSNHPFGGIEGLMLLKILLTQRSDSKLMTNFLLKKIKPIEHHVIPVNPFENKDYYNSASGIKETLAHLKNGGVLGTFPAGEVSSFQTNSKRVTDREWQLGLLKLIQKSEVPVVPIYFKGNNGVVFHLLGLIHPILRTAKLPSELMNRSNKTIQVRIGKPISVKDQQSFSSTTQLGRYLRAKTYALGSPLEVKRFFSGKLRALKKPVPTIDAIPTENLLIDIEKLRENKQLLHTQKEFEIYIASSDDIPNVLTEIGRLRELTFRSVGEGTNRAIDLDEFDLYYHHLFLWDKENNKLVGAYRLGKGGDIMEMYGKRGFYIQSLFKMKKQMDPILRSSIELGRSFVTQEYQRKILPLFLLWKGILYFLIKNPEYRYLIGPVSISNHYSKLSKGLMIEFIKRNFYRADLAEHVTPKKKFKPKYKQVDATALLEKSGSDIRLLDQFIQEIEPERFNVPVLLKKYIKQNARIIGFNVDPKFGMALDGLMILDLNDLPTETIDDLKKDFEL